MIVLGAEEAQIEGTQAIPPLLFLDTVLNSSIGMGRSGGRYRIGLRAIATARVRARTRARSRVTT